MVYGQPGDDDEIVEPSYLTLTRRRLRARAADQVLRGGGTRPPGPFGYTVRVLPKHPLLASRAELGLVTYPDAPAGMTNGDLR